MLSLLTPQIAATFMDDAARAGRMHVASPKVPQPRGALIERFRGRRTVRAAHA